MGMTVYVWDHDDLEMYLANANFVDLMRLVAADVDIEGQPGHIPLEALPALRERIEAAIHQNQIADPPAERSGYYSRQLPRLLALVDAALQSATKVHYA